LCLFRIVQEGLRNVKKHSGASGAHVALEHLDGNLHLSISDEGAGFVVNDAAKRPGLGLFSMQERAHLIGARFEIHSETRKGTRIDVWVSRQQQAKSESPAVVQQPAVYET
jgi:signal transduction histidine kinase